MALRVVGAGLGRTGTNSLKLALEQLLGGPCYHMFELVRRPQDAPDWERAVRGETVDWDGLMQDFAAAVDWPAAAFWPELWAANPEALVLLSTRDSPQTWWASMERTIVARLSRSPPPEEREWVRRRAMILAMMDARLTPGWRDRDAAIAAYEHHNERVRREVPAARLIDWCAGDGWEPICARLELPVPDAPFPHENRTADFRAAMSLDGD
jgi:hypothetical protein